MKNGQISREEQIKQAAKEKKEKPASGFVASKSGKKYYEAGSAQGDKISKENLVVFKTEKEAEEAGYTA